MKRFAAKFSMTLIVAFCLFAYNVQAQKFYDYGGKFKIQFPGNPTPGTQNLETDMGPVVLYQFIYESQTAAYMVSYVDYPADKMKGQDYKALLDRAKNGFIGALNLTTVDSMYINYGRHQGLMFHGEGAGMYCVMRDYLVDNRLYQLGILQVSAISIQEENEFFDSFELVK
ncbi:MAG: hypothetical protein U0W24_05390 [Bacteroidales bacterium]